MFSEYISFFFFIIFNTAISSIFLLVSYGTVHQEPNVRKSSAYECGFQPFSYNISFFEIKYYIQALLFLIFDLEIMFLLPFIMSMGNLGLIGIMGGLAFFLILLLGFLFEWKIEALEWQ